VRKHPPADKIESDMIGGRSVVIRCFDSYRSSGRTGLRPPYRSVSSLLVDPLPEAAGGREFFADCPFKLLPLWLLKP